MTDSAAHDGARLRKGMIDGNNTAASVWADTACRSQANEDYLDKYGKVRRIHRKKPSGKPMMKRTASANAQKSGVHARVERVFAYQKGSMALVIRASDLARARAAITLAKMGYNMRRWC